MRLELIEGNRNNLIINDVYNNDINSLKIALDFQQQRATDADLEPVLILTEIQQSALNERPLYSRVGELIGKYRISKFYGIGKELFAYREFFPEEIGERNFFPSVEDFLSSDIPQQLSQSCILIKGARSFHCERISDRLSRKVHETTLEVDLDAVAHNLQYYRSKLPQGTQCIAMVKAQGYGVGAYEVAKKLDQMHVGALAVAVADEGRELRSQGILSPILVMNPEPTAFDTLLEWHLEPVVFSWKLLRALANKIDKQGFDNIGVANLYLEFLDFPLEKCLFIFCIIVLGVFGKIAKSNCGFQTFCNFNTADALKVVEFLNKLIVTVLGQHDLFFCHEIIPFILVLPR